MFACKVNAVKRKELPALDDEFAKDVSEFDTLAEYKADLKNKLTQEAEARADRDFEEALVKAVVDGAEVDIPEVMFDNEVEDMIAEFEQRLSVQGIKLEQYLSYVGMTREQLAEEYKVQAKVSVKTRLVMEEIVKREELKFEEEELEAKLAEYATRYNQPVEDFKKRVGRDFYEHVANQVLSEKLMAMLKAENGGEKKAPAKKAAAKKEGAEDAEKRAPAKKPAAKKAPAKKDDAE